MSEHDEAGSAFASPPPPPPPPPPQPAARSASTAVRPISAARNGLLLTLPPQSPVPPQAHAGPRREGASIRAVRGLMQARTAGTVAGRRSGGTGRRAGLKIRWGKPRVGSSPTFGTGHSLAS